MSGGSGTQPWLLIYPLLNFSMSSLRAEGSAVLRYSRAFVYQVGRELERSFDGQAANLVVAAKGSAVALVDLVTKHFPGTRVKHWFNAECFSLIILKFVHLIVVLT